MSDDQRVSIDLSPAKSRETKTNVEPRSTAVDLRVEELEERIAPLSCAGGTHIPEVKV